MLIADARAYTSAVGNRAKGGGFEYAEYYANCDIEFMNLPNIHSVRNSFTALRSLVCDTNSSARLVFTHPYTNCCIGSFSLFVNLD